MEQHGGWITERDLAEYRPLVREPVRGTYRGFEVVSVPPPSSGGLHLIQLLNIVEGYDVRALGHNSADYVHLMAEAMKQVYADRERYTADPAFTSVPVALLLSKKSAKAARQRIDRTRARFDYQPTLAAPGHSSTSHLSVVDAAGNAVALTQTINDFFGSGVQVPGYGILLNDQMADFAADPQSPNAVAPGKRPQSTMAPTLLLRHGKVVAVLGTPGGARIISALAQIIVNIVDFGMSIDQAIEAPRFHCEKKTLYVEGRFAPAVVEELRRRGHPVQVREPYDVFFGGAQGILVDHHSGRLLGGADSRRFGAAVGY
jgi:gamma-glutamyltranspeptidase/glutathione hydrolase